MTCSYCQTENAESEKACHACGMEIKTEPALALVAPVGVVPNDPASHPFANARRKEIVAKTLTGIKNAVAAVFIVPTMATIGGIAGVLFFALLIAILDHLYFDPDFSRPYLVILARKCLPAGLSAGVPVGAFASLGATGVLVKNAGKPLMAFCALLALPFFVVPPLHFFPHVLKTSTLYHLPPGIFGGILLALPFLVFIKCCHSIFTATLGSRR